MGFLLDSNHISMGSLWYFYVFSMVFLSFYGSSVRFLWDFYDKSTEHKFKLHWNQLNQLKANWNQLTSKLKSFESKLKSVESKLKSIENQLKLKVIKLKSIENQLILIENQLKSVENQLKSIDPILLSTWSLKKSTLKWIQKLLGGALQNWPFFYGITPTLPKIQGNEKLKPPTSKAPGSSHSWLLHKTRYLFFVSPKNDSWCYPLVTSGQRIEIKNAGDRWMIQPGHRKSWCSHCSSLATHPSSSANARNVRGFFRDSQDPSKYGNIMGIWYYFYIYTYIYK